MPSTVRPVSDRHESSRLLGHLKTRDRLWFVTSRGKNEGKITLSSLAPLALMLGGPDRDTCFNLANVLHALGRKAQAAERYRQALELDHSFVEAWNNLGTVLAELGDNEESEQSFEEVLRLDPQYADAHYNLADLLDRTGRKHQAIEHFRAYLQHDSVGPWSDHARRRLRS